jgi:hypothetical protein
LTLCIRLDVCIVLAQCNILLITFFTTRVRVLLSLYLFTLLGMYLSLIYYLPCFLPHTIATIALVKYSRAHQYHPTYM